MAESSVTLHRSSEQDDAGARALQRRHRAGLLVKVIEGVFVEAPAWAKLDGRGRHLLLARALGPTIRPTAALSHLTAALAYGWPVVGLQPDRVHVTDGATTRTEHRAHLVRHAGSPEIGSERWVLGGIPLTSRLRTAVDLATTLEPASAAVAIDHAVRNGSISVEQFAEALPPRPSRGSVRARTVSEALDAAHESVGESYTAIRMVQLGLPRPSAQHPFTLPGGRTVRVDFWVPELGLVVEFDGKQKYRDPEMMNGADPGEAVWREKIREDRLRALPEVRAVVRPTWWHLVELDRFHTLFRQHRLLV